MRRILLIVPFFLLVGCVNSKEEEAITIDISKKEIGHFNEFRISEMHHSYHEERRWIIDYSYDNNGDIYTIVVETDENPPKYMQGFSPETWREYRVVKRDAETQNKVFELTIWNGEKLTNLEVNWNHLYLKHEETFWEQLLSKFDLQDNFKKLWSIPIEGSITNDFVVDSGKIYAPQTWRLIYNKWPVEHIWNILVINAESWEIENTIEVWKEYLNFGIYANWERFWITLYDDEKNKVIFKNLVNWKLEDTAVFDHINPINYPVVFSWNYAYVAVWNLYKINLKTWERKEIYKPFREYGIRNIFSYKWWILILTAEKDKHVAEIDHFMLGLITKDGLFYNEVKVEWAASITTSLSWDLLTSNGFFRINPEEWYFNPTDWPISISVDEIKRINLTNLFWDVSLK